MANETHYCAALMPIEPDEDELKRVQSHRAALLKSAKWPLGSTITVKFLGGDASLRARVEAVAKEWTRPGRANLNLFFTQTGPADIRIAFIQGAGSSSMIGTDCRKVKDQNKHTMNYGWLTPASTDADLRRVVLHEFGHALGLIHEHQNPQQGIKWNKPAVIRDLSGPPNSWTKAQIERNMFKVYDKKKVAATKLDKDSIMLYPIPKAWTLDGFSAELNRELSPLDIALIANQYP